MKKIYYKFFNIKRLKLYRKVVSIIGSATTTIFHVVRSVAPRSTSQIDFWSDARGAGAGRMHQPASQRKVPAVPQSYYQKEMPEATTTATATVEQRRRRRRSGDDFSRSPPGKTSTTTMTKYCTLPRRHRRRRRGQQQREVPISLCCSLGFLVLMLLQACLMIEVCEGRQRHSDGSTSTTRHPFLIRKTVSSSLFDGSKIIASRRRTVSLSKHDAGRSGSAEGPRRRDDECGAASCDVAAAAAVTQRLRGGSTKVAEEQEAPASEGATATADDAETDEVRSYRLRQQLHLESRSLQLRQALIGYGLEAFRHGEPDSSKAAPKVVDWDCALSTEEYPKSCLYSFDAEIGAKVIAPIDTQQWITLSALNRLRRTDPTKVEPLWHSQYAVLQSWMNPDSSYSLYTHLSPIGTLLSFLLDAPALLGAAMIVVIATALLLTFPIWEVALQQLLTSQFLWMSWPNWARFVHAALPLKLLLGQMGWKFIAVGFGKVYHRIRDQLVECECQMWQNSIPLTILEGVEDDVAAGDDNDEDDNDEIEATGWDDEEEEDEFDLD